MGNVATWRDDLARKEELIKKLRGLESERAEVLTRAAGNWQERATNLDRGIEKLQAEIDEINLVFEANQLERMFAVDGEQPTFNVNTRGDDPHAYAARPGLPATEVRAAAIDAVGSTEGVSDEKAAQVADVMRDDAAARYQLAKSSPAYARAFTKYLTNREAFGSLLTADEGEAWANAQRAAITIGSHGSVLVPTVIDPSFIFTDDSIGPDTLRSIGRNVTINASSWNGVLTPAISASVDAEGAAVSDDTPVPTAVSADLVKAQAFAQWTYEAEQDQGALMGELQRSMAEAKVNLEEQQLASGSGSGNETEGLITALDGSASEDTTPGTAETLALADLYDLFADLPTRHVKGDVNWLMHHGTSLSIRELVNAESSAEGTWTDVAAGRPPLLLGAPVRYHDECFNYRTINTAATAANTAVAIVGDASRFLVIDHISGVMLEPVPMVMDQSTGFPQGVRGLYMTWRFAAKCVDPDAFRMLSIPTTA